MSSNQRGAALIETAIVFPLILLLALGAAEFGHLIVSRAAVSEAARSAGIVAVDAQTDPEVDYLIVRTFATAFTSGAAGSPVKTVVVFDPKASGFTAPRCLTKRAKANGGVDGMCNVYDQNSIAKVLAGDRGDFGDEQCENGADHHWCPVERDHGMGASLGILVEVDYGSVTSFFGWVDSTKFVEIVIVSNEGIGYDNEP